jgi:hypothetical protein
VIQVGIVDNLMAGGISIAMRMKGAPSDAGSFVTYARPTDTGFPRWETVDPRETLAHDQAPLLTLEDDMALALLDALQRHYQGSSDTRMLRADYDAERKRVDKLIGTLTDLAARPQAIQLRKAEQ